MKTSWKNLICSIAIAAILGSQVTVAQAGLFTSVVKKAAGVALSGGGAGASVMRKAADVALGSDGGSGAVGFAKKVAQGVVPGGDNSLTGKILGKARDIATNDPNSLAGKVLGKVKQAADDPNSLTSRVLNKAKTAAADPNSITSKLITKVNAAGADPNSITNKVLNRAKTALNDPNSLTTKLITKANAAAADPNSITNKVLNRATTALNDPNSITSRAINRAKQSFDDPNSLANKLVNKAGEAVNDPNSLTSRLINRAENAVNDPNSLTNRLLSKAGDAIDDPNSITNKLINKTKTALDDGTVEGALIDLEQLADKVANGAANAANANQQGQDDNLDQIIAAGIQAGGMILSSALANGQPVSIPVSSFDGGYVPVSYASQGYSQPVEEVAAAPSHDLELADLRFVDNGNSEQGPRYRVTVKNLSRTDVTSEITVALLASMEANSDDNVSTLGSLQGLAAGEAKSVDLRLPRGSQVLEFLTAVAALTDETDANETDNIATFARDSVRETALQLSSIRIEKGVLVLSGEGFGRDAGKLTLKVGSTNLPINEAVWTATEVAFKLPKVDFSKVKAGQLQVVRADGRTTQPLALNFAR